MDPQWIKAADLAEVINKGRKVVKLQGRQIALFNVGSADMPDLRACNNRCPHEGYPLIEGTLSEPEPKTCLLTCNWHNWKFDLDDGAVVGGGDPLRLYPVTVADGSIYLDLTDPPAEERQARALGNFEDAFLDHDYDRLARELARLLAAGGTAEDALIRAIEISHDRYEYGMTHAYGAAADWLALAELAGTEGSEVEARKLVPFLEAAAYMAWDSLREDRFPFTDETAPEFDSAALAAAIEDQNEALAIQQVNAALQGVNSIHARPVQDLFKSLRRAALAHYQGFGHAMIYTYKAHALIERLGMPVLHPVARALTRYLINTSREDLIPEFRSYAGALENWQLEASRTPEEPEAYTHLSVPKTLGLVAQTGKDPETLYSVLLEAASLQFLRYRVQMQQRTDSSVSDNVGWLDFTHAITFANAARWAANQDPELWPSALLQMGCFLGRNSGFQDDTISRADWTVEEPDDWLHQTRAGLLNHDEPEYIVSAHYVKLTTAIAREIEGAPAGRRPALTSTMTAALNRMLQNPIRRHHPVRSLRQALDFVARE